MSLASELGKLKELKDSGAITQQVFEQLRNRLLDECVRRIEALHDQKPLVRAAQELAPIQVSSAADVGSAMPMAMAIEESGQGTSAPQSDGERDGSVTGRKAVPHIGWELPPVKVVHGTVQHIRFLQPEQKKPLATAAGSSQPLEFITPAPLHSVAVVGGEISASTTLHSVAAAGVECGTTNPPASDVLAQRLDAVALVERAVSPATSSTTATQHTRAVPRLDFSPSPAQPSGAAAQAEREPATPPQAVADTQVELSALSARVSGAVAVVEIGVAPPTKSNVGALVEISATTSEQTAADTQVELSALSTRDPGAVVLVETGAASPMKSSVGASVEVRATTPEASGVVSPIELGQAKSALPDDCHLFESFYQRKPPVWARWGLPPVKVVRGVARNVHFSNEDDEAYAASLEVDGQRVEIDSSSSIGIDAGDHLTLGGYEREGKLLALAYHNDSKGAHSDLRRLRRGYRFLFTIGWTSLLAGLGAVAGTVILLILRQRVGAFGSGLWGFAPYALSGLAAMVVSYFGLGLSFLGARAKEFHDAMNPSRAWQK